MTRLNCESSRRQLLSKGEFGPCIHTRRWPQLIVPNDSKLPSAQIASFAAEYNEQNEKLGQLKLKLEEHQTQKQVITSALAAAKRECEQRKGFTKSEAFELERESILLQLEQRDCHMLNHSMSNSSPLQRNSRHYNLSIAGLSKSSRNLASSSSTMTIFD